MPQADSKNNDEFEQPILVQTTFGVYSRLEYIKNWKKIKRKQHLLESDKLTKYIDDLVNKYPEKYLEILRFDLSTSINFNKIVSEMDFFGNEDGIDNDEDDDEIMSTLKSRSLGSIDVEAQEFEP